MKKFFASFGLISFFISSFAFAENSIVHKRGIYHLCSFLLARFNSGNKTSGTHDLSGKFDDEIDNFLSHEWVPDRESPLWLMTQMKQVADAYEQLRVEGFSSKLAKLAATKNILDDLNNLRHIGLSDDHIFTVLDRTKYVPLEKLSELVTKSKWSIDSSVEMFVLSNKAWETLLALDSDLHHFDAKADSAKSEDFSQKFKKAKALVKNLSIQNVILLSNAGYTVEKAYELCALLAEKHPQNGTAVQGYLLARSHEIPHDEAVIFSAIANEKNIRVLREWRWQVFSPSDLVKVYSDPYLYRYANSVFERALTTNRNHDEALNIALNHTEAFVRWYMSMDHLPYNGLPFEIPVVDPNPK